MSHFEEARLSKRDEFLLHLYDNLWRSIDRVESGVWQFVALWAIVVGLVVGVTEARISPTVASILSLVLAFWGINVALNAAKWFNRNRLFVVNIEKQFLLQSDLGRILPQSYHDRRPRLWNFLNTVHATAFAASGVVITWHYWSRVQEWPIIIAVIAGIAVTYKHWKGAAAEVREFINSTNP